MALRAAKADQDAIRSGVGFSRRGGFSPRSGRVFNGAVCLRYRAARVSKRSACTHPGPPNVG